MSKNTYFIQLDGAPRDSFLSAAKSAAEATEAQMQALSDELTNDPRGYGYASMSDAEAFEALTMQRMVPNTTPQSRLNYTDQPTAWLYNEFFKATDASGKRYLYVLQDAQSNSNAMIAAIAKDAVNLLSGPVTPLALVKDGEDTELKRGLQALVSLSVIPASLYESLTSYPNPNWPKLVPYRRSDDVLGHDVYPSSPAVIAAARAM